MRTPSDLCVITGKRLPRRALLLLIDHRNGL